MRGQIQRVWQGGTRRVGGHGEREKGRPPRSKRTVLCTTASIMSLRNMTLSLGISAVVVHIGHVDHSDSTDEHALLQLQLGHRNALSVRAPPPPVLTLT
jgi:hypothetical protein